MPEPVQSSWADEIEEGDASTLPAPSEKVKGDTKVVTEYVFNEDGKKVKVVRTYKIERKMVPKSVAQRRNWAKFGMSKGDKPGPNPQVSFIKCLEMEIMECFLDYSCCGGDLDELRRQQG